MSECGHVVIQKTYQYDRQKNITGEYWICVGCKLRFVPMGLAEAENAALKQALTLIGDIGYDYDGIPHDLKKLIDEMVGYARNPQSAVDALTAEEQE